MASELMGLGTHDLRDTSPVLNFGGVNTGEISVADFGEEEAYAEVARVLEIHNSLVAEMVDELCQVTTDYQAVYGGVPRIRMVRGNEYSNPLVSKVRTGTTMGFPLEKSEAAVQWTTRALEEMSLAKFQLTVRAILLGDVADFRTTLMNAIFNPTNDEDYEDYMVDYRSIPIYAFLNGDGKPVPAAIDGTLFDPDTHNHYMYATELDRTAVRSALTNLREHGTSGRVRIFISNAFVQAFFNFASDGSFYAFPQANVVDPNRAYAVGETLDFENQYNRNIGYFDGALVTVRSWVPQKYLVVADLGQPGDKPLAYRVMPGGRNAELGLRYEHRTYPLHAEVFDRYYGIAPWQRHKVVVLYIDSAATEYVAPTSYTIF